MLMQIVYLRVMEMGSEPKDSMILYKMYLQSFQIIQIPSRRILKLVKLLISNQISLNLTLTASPAQKLIHKVIWIFQMRKTSLQSFPYASQNKTNQKINKMIKRNNLPLSKFKEIKFINQLKASSKIINIVASSKSSLLHQK